SDLRLEYNKHQWWVELIVITDKRFLITSGIVVTKISMMPITKVTDMSYLRSFGGRLLGYGTLRVESAGQKQDLERVSYLPKPEATFDAISELIFGEKKQPSAGLRPPPPRSRRSFAR
ncbi:MAG: PH domain-containing protein, partial [Actinomycetota bacterium]|nr:PH domain-containing protein [Actinomycetota bacterium]